MGRPAFFTSILFALSGCIGTDVLDDSEVGARLEVSPDRIAVLVGNSAQAKATHFNSFGQEETVNVKWASDQQAIATVDGEGKIMGVSPGQALITATHNDLANKVRVTVVKDENAPATVDISAARNTLAVGENLGLTVEVKTINNTLVAGGIVNWVSTNENVIIINAAGTIDAVGNGSSVISAEVDGIVSNEIEFTVSDSKTGTFMKSGGYEAKGTATFKIVNGDLILVLSEDFETSFALGTFIYLSNTISSGNAVRSGGIEVSEITANGGYAFSLSEKFPDITISDYTYVIILCKPAGAIFGYAEMN